MTRVTRRLQATRTLWEMLPAGKASSGDEFARIVNLLLFHAGRRSGTTVILFDDRAGDWCGLDAAERGKTGVTGYQHKFYPSPLTDKHRSDIEASLKIARAAVRKKKIQLTKWVLVTPQDMVESSQRRSGGDVTWFEGLHKRLRLPFRIEHWGHTKLQALFLESPPIGLFYYPELFPDGLGKSATIQELRTRYDKAFAAQYRDIEFVGMSVYKEQAARTVPMENIYIPLAVVPNEADVSTGSIARRNPLDLLTLGSRHVILGDPGSGKTTLLRFLALAGRSRALQKRYGAGRDDRLPIVVTLRRYVDEMKKRGNLSLVEYIRENIEADFTLPGVSLEFLEYYLETGRSILLFDGLDELPSPSFKKTVRDRIRALGEAYPGNTIIVTSRIYGYEGPFRFSTREFTHHRLAKLTMGEIDQFIKDWYAARVEKPRDREDYVNSLSAILRNKEHEAIRELARNPLLLTIIVLVHRIDAVLPDERHVLYLKCTETLLNTWHTWKFHDLDTLHRAKVDRQNVQRMQAIAYWMHHQGGGMQKKDQAVVPYDQLHDFLSKHIALEQPPNPNYAPEDIATAFLEFVQDRAGLLTEVGNRRFSFVHLTFQEYLTAVHIKTLSELNGLKKAWKEEIEDHCCDPRWREVIRLLVATYGSNDSQEFLADKILKDAWRNQERVRLTAGFLLDGVAAAIAKKKSIFQNLVRATASSNQDELSETLSALRACVARYDPDMSLTAEALHSLANGSNAGESAARLRLVSISLGRSLEDTLGDCGHGRRREHALLSLFFGARVDKRDSQALARDMALLWASEDALLLDSPSGNLVAAVCQGVTSACERQVAVERAFILQMVSLALGLSWGPMQHLLANNHLLWTREDNRVKSEWGWAMHCFELRGPRSDRSLDRALREGLDLDQPRPKSPRSPYRSARNRANALAHGLSRIRLPRDFLSHRGYVTLGELLRSQIEASQHGQREFPSQSTARMGQDQKPSPIWEAICKTPDIHMPILEFLCDVFDLRPRNLWCECLRSIVLSRVESRVFLLDPIWWEQIKTAFETGLPSKEYVYGAAWLLMFDGLRHVMDYPRSVLDSLPSRVAELTRDNDCPLLRIANCVRDLSYGRRSRIQDLVAMIQSDDPAYRKILDTAYWRPACRTRKRTRGH